MWSGPWSITKVPIAVHVEVHNATGDVLKFDIKLPQKVEHVKHLISEVWRIPPSCQNLWDSGLIRSTELEDKKDLGEYCRRGDSTLPLSMELCLDRLREKLKSVPVLTRECQNTIRKGEKKKTEEGAHVTSDEPKLALELAESLESDLLVAEYEQAKQGLEQEEEEAKQRLAELEERKRKRQEQRQGKHFDDPSSKTAGSANSGEHAVENALAENSDTSARGTSAHITNASSSAPNPVFDTKQALADLLSLLKMGGDIADTALITCLEDDNLHVRHSLLQTLSHKSLKSDDRVVTMISKRLEHRNAGVRCSALNALSKVCPIGDESLLDAAMKCAEDSDSDLKCASMDVLLDIVSKESLHQEKKQHKGKDSAATSAEKDENASNNEPVVRTEWTEAGCKIFGVIAKLLEDDDKSVRNAALQTLLGFTERGDQQALKMVLKCLCSSSRDVRATAFRALIDLAPRGEDATITEVLEILERRNYGVRCAALQAITIVCIKDDQRAVAAVLARLEDWDDVVRRMAVRTIAEVAEVGNKQAKGHITSRLEQTNLLGYPTLFVDARKVSLQALPKVVAKGDVDAIRVIEKRLVDTVVTVQSAALEALGDVAEKGDEHILAAVEPFLKAKDALLRESGLRSFAKLSHPGDERVVGIILERLEDESFEVRRVAAESLPGVATQGDERIITALIALLSDKFPSVRNAVLHALCALTDEGDERFIDDASKHLKNSNEGVRCSALKYFTHISKKGSSQSIETAIKYLDDPGHSVRSAAVEAVAKLVPKHTKSSIIEVCEKLEHRFLGTRRAVREALAEIVEKGDAEVVASVMDRVRHDHERVRCAALQALAVVLEKGAADDTIINDLFRCLEDESASVRRLAMEVMGEVMEKGDTRIIQQLAARLMDDRDFVRNSAAKGFAEVVDKGDQNAIEAVFPHLENDNDGVRSAALLAMENIALKDDERVLELLSAKVEKWTAHEKAMQELKELLLADAHNPEKTPGVLTPEELDTVKLVKEAFESNDQSGILVVSQRVQHPNAQGRLVALYGLGKVLDDSVNNLHAGEIAAICLEDEDASVRLVAVDTLKKVPEKSRERARAVVSLCLKEQDEALRVSVFDALSKAVDDADSKKDSEADKAPEEPNVAAMQEDESKIVNSSISVERSDNAAEAGHVVKEMAVPTVQAAATSNRKRDLFGESLPEGQLKASSVEARRTSEKAKAEETRAAAAKMQEDREKAETERRRARIESHRQAMRQVLASFEQERTSKKFILDEAMGRLSTPEKKPRCEIQ